MAELEEEEASCFRDQTAKKMTTHVSPICDIMSMTIWQSCS